MSDLHPDRLPFLNAALLQTPGGRKFQAFLHILSSHVVRTRVAQLAKKVGEEEHCLLRHSKEGCQRTQVSNSTHRPITLGPCKASGNILEFTSTVP